MLFSVCFQFYLWIRAEMPYKWTIIKICIDEAVKHNTLLLDNLGHSIFLAVAAIEPVKFSCKRI